MLCKPHDNNFYENVIINLKQLFYNHTLKENYNKVFLDMYIVTLTSLYIEQYHWSNCQNDVR